MNLELLDRAAGATTCNLLSIGGGSLATAGFVGIVAGGPVMLPLAAGAAMLLAANYGCGEMPLGDAAESQLEGCTQVATRGALQVHWVDGTTFDAFNVNHFLYGEGQDCQKITRATIERVDAGGQQPWWIHLEWRGESGQEYGSFGDYKFSTEEAARTVKWSIRPFNDDCTGTSDGPPPLPPEMFEPQPYTDEVTNCNFNITFQGLAQPVPDGPVKPVYLLQQGTSRAAGGVMGGCNWPDTIFMPGDGGAGGGGEPPVYIPVPDDGPLPDGPDGVPWWAKPLLGAATNAALTLIGQSLEKLSIPPMEAGSYTMVAPCDFDAEGNPEARTWTFEKTTQMGRLLMHQVALMDMVQQHLVWKTPTCGDEGQQPGEGDWRTISFRSDKTSPYGKSRLRKRFRYRSTSGWSYDDLILHWKDFVWKSGPVVVKHLGSSWGTPQVWAATADEGKRVIRHAAGEAGIDPDQVGRWSISGSGSPRLGVSDTMRVETKGGYFWITARDGSDARPLVSKVPEPGSGFDITE